MQPILGTFLVLIASASPLLTFTWLWQIKEWRVDRLREHLKAEGWIRQLTGIVRPAIVATAIATGAIMGDTSRTGGAALLVLAGVSVAQILLKKQRYPVWTTKALMIAAVALLFTCGTAYALRPTPYALVVLVLLQPAFVALAWLLLLPLDQFLKRRIMRQASALRNRYENVTVIGITGSVGKTTTKELIAHILQDQPVIATTAYVNSEMGVSQWLLKELPKWNPLDPLTVIVEMGAYRIGEIRTLCDIVQPSMGVVTYIGSQHVALFGSQEKLCDAKVELLECLPESGRAFLNGDNALCVSLKGRCRCPVTTVGTGGHEDIEAFDIEETGEGIRFRVGETRFSLPLHGTHNVSNVLLSIAVAEALGAKRSDIASRLMTFRPLHRTFTVRTQANVTILDDTHNASPESFRAAVAWAKSQPAERKILLTPGLIELGEQTQIIHRDLGAQAKSIFTRVIFTERRGSESFCEGFGRSVETIDRDTERMKQGDLLVCVGRMPQKTIAQLLP